MHRDRHRDVSDYPHSAVASTVLRRRLQRRSADLPHSLADSCMPDEQGQPGGHFEKVTWSVYVIPLSGTVVGRVLREQALRFTAHVTHPLAERGWHK
jgi:hypothetical protein